MDTQVGRRDFLRTTSVAAGALAQAVAGHRGAEAAAQSPKPSDVKIGTVPYSPVADYPIQGQRFSRVTLKDTFWKPRVTTNATVTIPLLAERMLDGGRGLNGNVLEAAILSLEAHPDPKLQAVVDKRIGELRAQPRGGNGGFEVAAAYSAATGKRDLIDNAIKAADDLYADFKTNNPPFSGGERDAVNCIQLYRATRDKKHLDLAKHYLDIRGLDNSVNRSRHNQSYKPVLEQSDAVGHAVNCVTLMMSLLDVGVLTGLKEYADAARRMWLDAVSRKMYVTGGVGSTGNEGFGEPYSLPNISAYAETCAVLMFATLNHKLFLASGDSKYIDVLERGIYNNALSGVALSGNRFFYVNRLASAGDGRDTRWERASLECCPPNLVRFLASMPGYIYAHDKAGVYVNLYVSSDSQFTIDGKPIALSVDSEMPWGGKSTIKVSAKEDLKGAIRLRIPGWARNTPVPGALYSYVDKATSSTAITINGNSVTAVPDERGYVSLNRLWHDGDTIEVSFPMAVKKVVADAKVRECRGRVAIERGPIVYCAEWPEAADRRALALWLDPATDLEPDVRGDLWGWRDGHQGSRERTVGSRGCAPAHHARSLSPVGESRRWRDECLALDEGVFGRRYGPGRRPDLLHEPELRVRRLALSRGGSRRSESWCQMGVFPHRHLRRARHRGGQRTSEHRRYVGGVHRTRNGSRSVLELRPERRRRVVPPVERRIGVDVPELESDRNRRLS